MHRSAFPTLLSLAALTLAACSSDVPITAHQPSFTIGNPVNDGSREPYTLAVIGDTPYGPVKRAEFPGLIALINGDPKVDIVVHLGDIKAGKNTPCTDEYFADIRSLFDQFEDPFVYTPGDNEWTDCHASRNNGLYTPTERLAAVRQLFFPVPGQSLGGRKKQLLTEADDPANSAYVENTLWMESQVVFALLNITGSNNDGASWGSPLPADAASYPSQADEQASRAAANSAWLTKAFATAQEHNAAAVVLLFQADMWDTTEPSLSGFDALVVQIGTLAAAWGKPVLLFEGDSHQFRVDHPFSAGSPLLGVHPGTPVAENVTRIVVEGSDAGRTEYLRVTVDPIGKGGLFTWERVPLQ